MRDRPVPLSANPGEQLALAVFEETVSREGAQATLARSSTDITYRKSNVLIDVGELSLAARKGLNVMHFLASQAPADVQRFDVELGLFKFLMNYESRNHQHLEKALREAQKSSIRIERMRPNATSPDWISVPLVGAVGVAGGRVYFDFHPAIRKLHLDPSSYTYLSLRTSCVFTSIYAHGLYEHLKALAYKGSPTEWVPLEDVKRWLGVAETKWLAEFKTFRKEALQKAVDQLCELSDLHVEYETKSVPGSKKVGHIRFLFRTQSGALAVSVEHTQALRSLYDTLVREFGLGQSDVEQITQSGTSPERIKAAIDFVRHRIATQRKKISAPGRYLMTAIQEGYAIPTAEVEAVVPSAPLAAPAAADTPAPAAASRRAAPSPRARATRQAAHEQQAEQALQRDYQEQGERGYALYLAAAQAQRDEWRASFARTLVFRALSTQLQRAKGPLRETELHDSLRLRHALGQHVLKSMGKKPRGADGAAKDQSLLFPAQ
ncbi:replication initiation protein [Azohydromonas lata]|uniref:Replication initiation protein n=1 Tax=Azohydromonas lata TaxID=45677 RepID=A0ABU5I9J5_9BURK|nr:replication initiation protein [Azohydromonas lata]MDZ5455773.1 replication initiation protein [Azohydromonas lata]